MPRKSEDTVLCGRFFNEQYTDIVPVIQKHHITGHALETMLNFIDKATSININEDFMENLQEEYREFLKSLTKIEKKIFTLRKHDDRLIASALNVEFNEFLELKKSIKDKILKTGSGVFVKFYGRFKGEK